MICKVRSLKSSIKTPSFLEESINSSNEVIKDIEPDMLGGIRKLGNPTWESAAANYVIVNQNAGSWILALEIQAKTSDLWDILCIFVELYTRTYRKDWPWKTQFRNNAMQFLAVKLTEPAQKWLTLRGNSLVGGRCNIVTSIVANNGCWCVDCELTAFFSIGSIQDATSKIVDTPLTLHRPSFYTIDMIMSQEFWPRKAFDSSLMDWCRRTAPRYSKTPGLESLTLHCRWSSGHSIGVVEGIFAKKGGQ